jgi:hypothetical protein
MGTKASSTSSALGSLGSIVFTLRFAYYVLGVLASAVMAVYVCSYTIGLAPASARAGLEIFLVALLIVWLSLALAINDDSINNLPLFVVAVSLITLPTALLFLRFNSASHPLFFWLTLAAWVLFGILFFILGEANSGTFSLEFFIATVGVAWAISGTIISLGTLSFLPYASPALRGLGSARLLLDLRYSLGLIFLASILIATMIRAFRTQPPTLPTLAAWKIAEPTAEGIIASAVLPFIGLINVLLLVGCLITDYLLKAVLLVVFYFVEIGSNIVEILRRVFRENPVIVTSAKVIGAFILSVVALLSARASVFYIIPYLQSSNWWSELAELWIVVLSFAIILLCIGGITRTFIASADCAVVALATLLSVVFVAGLLLYGLARVDFLGIMGFDFPGPFSVAMVALIAAGIAKTAHPFPNQRPGGSKPARVVGRVVKTHPPPEPPPLTARHSPPE